MLKSQLRLKDPKNEVGDGSTNQWRHVQGGVPPEAGDDLVTDSVLRGGGGPTVIESLGEEPLSRSIAKGKERV